MTFVAGWESSDPLLKAVVEDQAKTIRKLQKEKRSS